MKILRNIISIVLLITIIMININNSFVYAQISPKKISNVAVLLFSFDDPYISLVRKSLEGIQDQNKSSVHFDFFDGKRNQNIQNELIDSVLQDNYDLILVNLVNLDENTVKSVINKIKPRNIPIIFFNTMPFQIEPIKSYNKAVVISTNAEQAGILQGKLIANKWISNKNIMDKNNDNILQYFMLNGPPNITVTVARTSYTLSTINDAGIKTKEIISKSCYWDEQCAKDSLELLFLNYGDKIEAIISNNDAMAIGAIKALQKYGYNNDDKSKYIPVFGIDGIPEAKDLISKGIMAGTVFQDPNETAEALYSVGMNLIYNRNPLENTNYKFNETGVTIDMPYHEYIP